LQSLDPHYAEVINKAEKPKTKARTPQVEGAIDPIRVFNERHSIHEVLSSHGYKQKGKRYIRPGSTSGIPGIVLIDDNHIYSHGGDVLADGHKHDAFDVYRLLACGGAWRQAFEWDPEITRHNQRVWRETKGKGQVRSRPGKIPGVEGYATFEVNEKGLWYCLPAGPDEDPPKPQWICSSLYVTAFTRDEHGEGWGRLLEFSDAENCTRVGHAHAAT
jgi:hypothetical protein